jgi:hypothetical protein
MPIMTVLSINRDDQVDKWLKETQALSAFIAETLKSPNLAALEECKKELETVLYGTRMSAGDLTVNLETQFDPVAEVKKRDEELRQKLPVVEQMIKIQNLLEEQQRLLAKTSVQPIIEPKAQETPKIEVPGTLPPLPPQKPTIPQVQPPPLQPKKLNVPQFVQAPQRQPTSVQPPPIQPQPAQPIPSGQTPTASSSVPPMATAAPTSDAPQPRSQEYLEVVGRNFNANQKAIHTRLYAEIFELSKFVRPLDNATRGLEGAEFNKAIKAMDPEVAQVYKKLQDIYVKMAAEREKDPREFAPVERALKQHIDDLGSRYLQKEFEKRPELRSPKLEGKSTPYILTRAEMAKEHKDWREAIKMIKEIKNQLKPLEDQLGSVKYYQKSLQEKPDDAYGTGASLARESSKKFQPLMEKFESAMQRYQDLRGKASITSQGKMDEFFTKNVRAQVDALKNDSTYKSEKQKNPTLAASVAQSQGRGQITKSRETIKFHQNPVEALGLTAAAEPSNSPKPK